ncbi:MAG: Gfo/Idh/MocA family oxidoreductase [Actinobacteria bacterium]|nr:Gfo/Idh/MocA family oxidoreductase [Actinomycetota bacterium]
MEQPIRMGLVGAGPWAQLFTGPLLAAGPHLVLDAVWARRPEAAAAVAERHGAHRAHTLDELIDRCDAIAFAVPPDVQAALAARVAAAGRPVLLDKPIGMTVIQAEQLAAAVDEAGVVSQVVLTNRYLPAMREFLDRTSTFEAHGGQAVFLGGGAMEGNYFGTPWRLEHGGLLDLGPHVLDALDVALGPIVDVRGAGDPLGTVVLTCTHQSGVVSSAVMSGTTPVEPSGLLVEVYGRAGRVRLDTAWTDADEGRRQFAAAMSTIASEFAAAVRSGVPHPLDARRGLHLQRLIDVAERSMR